MRYKYSSISISSLHILLACLCYFFIFTPLQEKYQFNLQQKQRLISDLQQIHTSHPTKLIFSSDNKLQNIEKVISSSHTALKFALSLAQQHQLQLDTITYSTSNLSATTQNYQIKMLGEFDQVLLFLHQLKNENLPLTFSELHLQHHEKSKLAVNIMLHLATEAYLDLTSQKSPPLPEKIQDPFCRTLPPRDEAINKKILLQSTALNLMQMVGYIGNAQHQQAIVMLPNQLTFSVGIGDVLSEQQAVIKAITPEKILLELKDQQVMEILSTPTDPLNF